MRPATLSWQLLPLWRFGGSIIEEEVVVLDKIWPDVKPYLRPEGIGIIENEGTSTIDFENDRVTPLIGNEECAYALLKDNIFICAIEKAWADGKISFQKPVSCHFIPGKDKTVFRFPGS